MKTEMHNQLKSSHVWKVLAEDWKCEEEIKARIAMAKEAFNKNNRLFCGNINLEMRRKRLMNCCVQ